MALRIAVFNRNERLNRAHSWANIVRVRNGTIIAIAIVVTAVDTITHKIVRLDSTKAAFQHIIEDLVKNLSIMKTKDNKDHMLLLMFLRKEAPKNLYQSLIRLL